jgi:hypothetical protein
MKIFKWKQSLKFFLPEATAVFLFSVKILPTEKKALKLTRG